MAGYKISELLDNSVQQFADMTDEELEQFGASFRKTIEDSPVIVALVDGTPVLVEGRQRLLLLQHSRRATLNDNEAVLVTHVTTMTEAEDEALRRNLNRRQFTRTEAGKIARKLMADRGLTQAEVGQILGISQSAVSKAVTAEPQEDGPVTVPQPREDGDGEVAGGEAQPDITAEELRVIAPEPPQSPQERLFTLAMDAYLTAGSLGDASSGVRVRADSDDFGSWTVTVTDAAAATVTRDTLREATVAFGTVANLIDAAVMAEAAA